MLQLNLPLLIVEAAVEAQTLRVGQQREFSSTTYYLCDLEQVTYLSDILSLKQE